MKSSLRQYNFGSDTRTVWNATIGVNERYRRLRYVVNGPSPGPLRERGRIHLSISCMLYAHNIELPTFSPYQSRGLTTPKTATRPDRVDAPKQSSITFHYTTDPRPIEPCIVATPTVVILLRARAFLNFTIKCYHGRRDEKERKKEKNIVHERNVFPSCSRKIIKKRTKIRGVSLYSDGEGERRREREKERGRYICINRRANET